MVLGVRRNSFLPSHLFLFPALAPVSGGWQHPPRMFALKILTVLLQPLGTALLAWLLALLLWTRCPRFARALAALALLWLWAWSTPLVSDALRHRLERQYPERAVAELPRADAIVVLGGAMEPAAPPLRLQPDMGSASDRVWHAARLYHAGKAPLIVISGGRLPWTPGEISEAEAMVEALRTLGVPQQAMLLEGESRTTRENALSTEKLLKARKVSRVLLVTSALHMPRALALFRAAGVEASPATTDTEIVPTRTHTALDFLPNAVALEGSGRAIKELLGRAHLAVFGLNWLGPG